MATYCAPGISKHDGSCFDRKGLQRIIRQYNSAFPEKAITYRRNTPNQILWQLIQQRLSDRCGDQEWCWLDQDFLRSDMEVQNYYKPPKPETQYKWLTTSDIDHVLKQFEKQYQTYLFLGAVPLDFDLVIDAYRDLNLCYLSGGNGTGNGKDRT